MFVFLSLKLFYFCLCVGFRKIIPFDVTPFLYVSQRFSVVVAVKFFFCLVVVVQLSKFSFLPLVVILLDEI